VLDPHTDTLIRQIFENADRRFCTSAISLMEGQFIHAIVKDHDISNTIEIGCANGISSVFICDALRNRPSPRHIIIDPNQTTEFGSVGLRHLAEANIDFYELIEKPSEIALPQLLEEGCEVDFAFVDGYHTFDHALVDFFYLNRLLRVGGYLVFDDNNMAAINKVIRYIRTYPAYKLIGTAGQRGLQRRALNVAKLALATLVYPFTKIAGNSLSHEILDGSLIRPKSILDLDYSTMVAFQKVADDRRYCDWYKYF
jgi:predicted O-methyltransferase YrrM